MAIWSKENRVSYRIKRQKETCYTHKKNTHTRVHTEWIVLCGGGVLATATASGWKPPMYYINPRPVSYLQLASGCLSHGRTPNAMVIGGKRGGRRERNYFYRWSWYPSYRGASNPKEKSHNREVMQLHPSLDLLDWRCLQSILLMSQGQLRVHLLCVLA